MSKIKFRTCRKKLFWLVYHSWGLYGLESSRDEPKIECKQIQKKIIVFSYEKIKWICCLGVPLNSGAATIVVSSLTLPTS